MKVFIRTKGIYASSSGETWSCGKEWIAFEGLLRETLLELGHEVIEQPYEAAVADSCDGARFKIYQHLTSREVAGDLFYKQMHLCELFTLDHRGWGADHSLANVTPDLARVDPEAAEAFCRDWSRKHLDSGSSKHTQPETRLPAFLPDDYIFVPLQKPDDYVQVHHSSIAVVDFIELIADWASRRRQNVVFKLHPGNHEDDPEVVECATRAASERESVFCVDGNVHDLIKRSLGVFTINSGVGFESLIHGKPLVTFGRCDYHWATFHAHAANLNDGQRYVLSYDEGLRQRAWQFVYYYCFGLHYFVSQENLANCRTRLLAYLANAIEGSLTASEHRCFSHRSRS
jgi:hypothetical protein